MAGCFEIAADKRLVFFRDGTPYDVRALGFEEHVGFIVAVLKRIIQRAISSSWSSKSFLREVALSVIRFNSSRVSISKSRPAGVFSSRLVYLLLAIV